MRPRSKERFTLRIILSYVVLGILAILAAYFIYGELKSYASSQNQEDGNIKLLRTNKLLTNLYEAESLSKLALQSKKTQDLKAFAKKVDTINKLIDSLKSSENTKQENQVSKLESVQKLLKQKVFNNAELRKLKVKNENGASLDSVLSAFHEMEVKMGRITPETFAPNFGQLTPKAQKSIRDYVTILNKNIPISNENTDANNIDSILKVSKSILNRAKVEMAIMERSLIKKELQIYRTDLELSQKMRSILADFEREMAQNAYLDNVNQEKMLKRSTRLAGGALILGLMMVILFTFLISKDYWKIQLYREQLEKEKKYSESLLKSREQLISTVSHDLRTPLSTINGYSELMEHSGISSKQLGYLNNVKSASEYMASLVNDLLDYSRLGAGQVIIEKIPFMLPQLISETVVYFNDIQVKKDIELKLDISEELRRPIVSDPFRIRQILANLIGNAFKFTDSGHVKVSALVEEKRDVAWLKIDVIDTGIGIKPEKQKLIFQEFTQVMDATEEKKGGYGLGLTISKKLTELLGGTLTLKSKEDKGSTFSINIPIEFSEKDRSTGISKKKNFASQPLSVLVLDDDDTLLRLITEICKINEIHVRAVSDFMDVSTSEFHQYDVVLTDIQMPKMDGFFVLKKLHQWEYVNPVIAMTGQRVYDKSIYIDAGFKDVLQKPLTYSSLLNALGLTGTKKKEKSGSDFFIPKPESLLFGIAGISTFLDNTKSIKQVLEVFLDTTIENLEMLFSAVNSHDYEDIRCISHKMLSMSRQLEIHSVVPILESLEVLEDDAEAEKVFNKLLELRAILHKLEKEIRCYLVKLQGGIA
ncbi:response regulator [Muricauda sp. JGD-17]|uniref:histidine kinase n=1 Tax=Flagellimonas ochracea TaxID=2696472 RepID=A0A964TEF6_9FLAO|nr:hybrid sensor histidine kinase/response regulator [Allomuricauda ochracea]NAY93335.1 response regulator [Allomuricauda ochracea]